MSNGGKSQEAKNPRKHIPKPDDFLPEPVFAPGHRWAGKARCAGWRSAHGRQCRKLARIGKRTCKTCGSGGRPPAFGKYATFHRLAAEAEQRARDPNLLNLRTEVFVAAQRYDQLLGRVLDGDPSPDFAAIRAAGEDIAAAVALNAPGQAQAAIGRLLALCDQGIAEDRTWERIFRAGEHIRKLATVQQAAELELGQMYSHEEVRAMTDVFQLLMFKFIPDSQMRAAFLRVLGANWRKLGGGGTLPVPPKDVTPTKDADE